MIVRRWFFWTTVGLLLFALQKTAHPSAESLGAWFRVDKPFSEYTKFWFESYADRNPQDGEYAYDGMPLGGSLHVYFRNQSSTPFEIKDVLLEGISLTKAIAVNKDLEKAGISPANLFYSALAETDKQKLMSSGEPIWWKVDPFSVELGQVGEVIIRLRSIPKIPKVQIELLADGSNIAVSTFIGINSPRIQGIGFSSDLSKLYFYAQHPEGGAQTPGGIVLDGNDITDRTTIAQDKACPVVPGVIQIPTPFEAASFHCLQIKYDDGSETWAGFRVWTDEMAYGIWGAQNGAESEVDTARNYLKDIAGHNVNVQMEMIGSDAVSSFLKSEEGQSLASSLNLRRMVGQPKKGNTQKPYAYFILDEPDAHDYTLAPLDLRHRLGSLGQSLISRCLTMRKADPPTPHLLNVDTTFKPDNWYVYGQMPDILATDPYYQERLREVFWRHPERFSTFTNAKFIHAVSAVAHSACAPKPLHLILNSVKHTKDNGTEFRYGTPEEKRIEVYYSLAAGAKGFSFWWYTPGGKFRGCGSNEPEAVSLWREIGLLGAEVRMIGDLVQRSAPMPVSVSGPELLRVSSLIVGYETMILICVNEDYACDRLGTMYCPIDKADFTATLPSWLVPREVFEISAEGTQNVTWRRNAQALELGLGKIDLTRLIVVTSNSNLRREIQDLYLKRFRENVHRLRGLAAK